MPLHPLANDFLERLNSLEGVPVHELTPDAARTQSRMQRWRLRGMDDERYLDATRLRVDDYLIDGPASMLELRIYRPAGAELWPGCMYFHGGGWVLGDLDAQDQECRKIAVDAGCVVVSVNYRHAPEFSFPCAPEDCYAATAWIVKNAVYFRIDPARLAVCGLSAGANLAAVVTLMARERRGPALRAQVLMVPVTNCDFTTPSYSECAEGYGLSRDSMQWFWQHYLASPDDAAHPWASPLRASDLFGLPPALVLVSEYDPLRDEGLAYARRLAEHGVAVETHLNAGMLHGFLGPQALPQVIAFLREQLK